MPEYSQVASRTVDVLGSLFRRMNGASEYQRDRIDDMIRPFAADHKSIISEGRATSLRMPSNGEESDLADTAKKLRLLILEDHNLKGEYDEILEDPALVASIGYVVWHGKLEAEKHGVKEWGNPANERVVDEVVDSLSENLLLDRRRGSAWARLMGERLRTAMPEQELKNQNDMEALSEETENRIASLESLFSGMAGYVKEGYPGNMGGTNINQDNLHSIAEDPSVLYGRHNEMLEKTLKPSEMGSWLQEVRAYLMNYLPSGLHEPFIDNPVALGQVAHVLDNAFRLYKIDFGPGEMIGRGNDLISRNMRVDQLMIDLKYSMRRVAAGQENDDNNLDRLVDRLKIFMSVRGDQYKIPPQS